MSTSPEIASAVKADLSQITDADVVAWLKARRDSYRMTGLSVGVDTDYVKPFVARDVMGGSESIHFGDTLDEAVARFSSHNSPRAKAALLRQKAANLLAAADTLDHAAQDEEAGADSGRKEVAA